MREVLDKAVEQVKDRHGVQGFLTWVLSWKASGNTKSIRE